MKRALLAHEHVFAGFDLDLQTGQLATDPRRFSIASRGTSGRPASSGIMAIAPSVVQPATSLGQPRADPRRL